MLAEVVELYRLRWDFFLDLALQHLAISGAACGIALVIGLVCGIVTP